MNSGIQSSSVDVQGAEAFRVQNLVQSITIEYARIIRIRIAWCVLGEPSTESSLGKRLKWIFQLSATALDGLC